MEQLAPAWLRPVQEDSARLLVWLGCLCFFLLALPADLEAIVYGGQARLSIGLSLKTFMTLAALVGLALDRTLGYAMLLGASLQISLVRAGDFLGVAPAAAVSGWLNYSDQLWLPCLDLLFRLSCFVFLGRRWRRMIGGR